MGDGVAVGGGEEDCPQDQHIERTLEHFAVFAGWFASSHGLFQHTPEEVLVEEAHRSFCLGWGVVLFASLGDPRFVWRAFSQSDSREDRNDRKD